MCWKEKNDIGSNKVLPMTVLWGCTRGSDIKSFYIIDGYSGGIMRWGYCGDSVEESARSVVFEEW